MNKKFISSVILGSIFFIGCAEKELKKEETIKDNYDLVIEKSIKDCHDYGIDLDEKRTHEFMRRSPKATIDKAAMQTTKTPEKLCQFFAEETSNVKLEKAEELASKIMQSCKKLGITLPKEGIYNKVRGLPFFVIEKGLAIKSNSSVDECRLMEKKYK